LMVIFISNIFKSTLNHLNVSPENATMMSIY
jgi:hypothetical protein